jgi:thiol-disulfide isomerase/thioredoxin
MHFIQVGTEDDDNQKDQRNDDQKQQELASLINDKNNGLYLFILIRMIGCGPCKATHPVWIKLEHASNELKNNDKIVVATITSDRAKNIPILSTFGSYPTIICITPKKQVIEYKEDNKRTLPDFINWINSQTSSSALKKQDGGNGNTRALYQNLKKRRVTIGGCRKSRRNKKKKYGRTRKGRRT